MTEAERNEAVNGAGKAEIKRRGSWPADAAKEWRQKIGG